MSGRRQGTIKETHGSVASSDSDSDLLIDNIDDDDEEDDMAISIGNDIEDFKTKTDEKRAISKVDHADDEF